MNNFPKVEYITFETEPLPKIGRVRYRPFILGEYKKLLEANELGDPEALIDIIAATIKACTFDKVPIETVEMYILDYLYLQIWMASKGNISKIDFVCNAEVKDENGSAHKCNTSFTVDVPLDKAKIVTPDNYKESEVIRISPTAGIKMKQPNIESFKRIGNRSEFEITDAFIYSSIECIYDGERLMYPGQDFDMPGLMEYLKTFPDNIVDQIVNFFTNSPELKLDLDVKCPKCKTTSKIELSGLQDFFD